MRIKSPAFLPVYDRNYAKNLPGTARRARVIVLDIIPIAGETRGRRPKVRGCDYST